MKNNLKRFLLCLLAVFMMSAGSSIHAAGNDEDFNYTSSDEAVQDSQGYDSETDKRQEKTEDVELTADQAEKFLHKIGAVDGLDIYYRSDDYKAEIWAAHGGDPKEKDDYDKKAEPDQDQLQAEAEIDLIKALGDIVAVNPISGKAVASFDESVKCDEGIRYVSDSGRFVLTVDEELTTAVSMLEAVSVIDDPFVLRAKDGKTLELMDRDYSEIIHTYRFDSQKDGKLVYKTDDGDHFVWVNPGLDQVFGTFRYSAENDNFRMLVDDRTAIIGLENKDTGYIWWSSPLGASRDETATPILIDELRSSSVLRYGIPERRTSNNWLRSNTNDCNVSVSDISGGIRVVYDYTKAGIKYPVEYTIEDDHLKASLKADQIEESKSANVAAEITLLGSFGAASSDEDGYFVIPDGSGALIRFNNGKTVKNSYAQKVYGADVTAVPVNKAAVTEQVYLPVYGIVKEDNAMLVVASKGDSNAILNASVSKQSNSSYNLCSFTFVLRNTDSFYMSGKNKEELTVFERGRIKSDDIELLYYPIAKENVGYDDIAFRYRQYLTDNAGVTVKAKQDYAPMYVDLYGGAEKKRPVLGIPVNMKTSITDFSEAKDIIAQLNNCGVDNMVVSYNNWTNDGIKNKVDTDAKPSGTLGGKDDFNDLTEYLNSKGFEFYPSSDNRDFYSGNGYYSFTSTAVRVSGEYSRIISYDRAYGIPDGFKKNMSLLSPSLFGEVLGDAASSYSRRGLDGISLGSLTVSLYGDYGKNSISRFDSMNFLTESYGSINNSLEDHILADGANAYALPYVDHITGVPVSSSGFDIFDEDIPFYQLVMHGLIPYSTKAVNGCADSEKLLLMAAATGSCIYYDLIYEDTSILKDTEFDKFFYANYSNWIETASAEYKLISSILSDVSAAVIDDYFMNSDGSVSETHYSNGTVIIVDFENKTIEHNGVVYDLTEYAEQGGIKF